MNFRLSSPTNGVLRGTWSEWAAICHFTMTPSELTAAAALVKLHPRIGRTYLPITSTIGVLVTAYKNRCATIDYIVGPAGHIELTNVFGTTSDQTQIPVIRVCGYYMYIVFQDTAFLIDLETHNVQLIGTSDTGTGLLPKTEPPFKRSQLRCYYALSALQTFACRQAHHSIQAHLNARGVPNLKSLPP